MLKSLGHLIVMKLHVDDLELMKNVLKAFSHPLCNLNLLGSCLQWVVSIAMLVDTSAECRPTIKR